MKHRTGYLFKRNGTYYVAWRVNGKAFSRALRDDNGQPISTKREAEQARLKVMEPFVVSDEAAALESLAGKLEGRKAELAKWEDEQNPPLPIAQAWTQFIASPNRPDSGQETLYQYECQWSAFVDWVKANHPELSTLRHVTKEIAEEYASSLNHDRFSPNTYNKHLNLLTLFFRVLKHRAKLSGDNVWESIQRKRLVTHSRRELTIDELKTICQSATGELRLLLALGVYSGLRLGDCATLRWAEVDLGQKLIRRIPNKTARRKPKPVIVPIHPVLLAMLAEAPTGDRGEYVLPELAGLYANRIDLVTDRVQAHFQACGIKTHKRGTGEASKLKSESGEKPTKVVKRAVLEVGFHSLRHTFVSLCRESNAPLAVVESIVGHSNPAMTRHYTHVGEAAAGLAVAALPVVIGGNEATPEPPKRDTAALLGEARTIAESLTGENWQEKKAALLNVLAGC
jgi:integrase